jgi:hypothetical protein
MPPTRDLSTPSASPSLATLDFLGRAPLIPGDDAAGYDTLLARVSGAVRPGDLIEEAWVRDVADLVWEAVRLRRLKAALMTACANEGMHKLLLSLDVPGALGLSQRWAARELDAVGKVDAVFAAAGLGMDHVMAQTLRLRIGEIERIDRMIASAEARRNATLREIAHRRERFAASLHRSAQAAAGIEDAEFEVVSPADRGPAQASGLQPAEAAA